MSKDKVILVISMAGYPKHGLHDRIDDVFDNHEGFSAWIHSGHGRHQYFYNSEGYQLMYFTNYSIPDDTHPHDVWREIWDYQDIDEIIANRESNSTEWWVPDGYEFTVNGQQYKYLGEIWGYGYDSTSPDDERYEA